MWGPLEHLDVSLLAVVGAGVVVASLAVELGSAAVAGAALLAAVGWAAGRLLGQQ
jgi:hypothetical protein